MEKIKLKVVVAGIGSVDECDCCHATFTSGVACWIVDEWKPIDLCDNCLKNKFEEI